MNYDEFIEKHLGKGLDYDGVSGVQCVDLIKIYLDEVFGIKAGAWGNAKFYWIDFNKRAPLVKNFTKISNSPKFVPQKGDICVWKGSINGGYGHVSIATGEGDVHTFCSYDQNWNGKPMKKVKHNYNDFYGVLRPKDQSKINPQTSSSKYEAWKNGSTKENIFKLSNLTEKIGSMNEFEKGKCYGKINGNYAVVYNIADGHYKAGFAGYHGKVNEVPNKYKNWQNGSSNEAVYADTAMKEKVGTIFPRGTAKCLDCIKGLCLVMYKINNSNNYKIGFVKYHGGVKNENE